MAKSSWLTYNFNPRTPREVRQLTEWLAYYNKDFNPRTPREVRHYDYSVVQDYFNFNPRTPREVRRMKTDKEKYIISFQSTHPARGATKLTHNCSIFLEISIHAPRERCDTNLNRLSFPC